MLGPEHNVQDVIRSYRRRRERMVPLLLGGLAVLLLAVGSVLIVLWFTGGGAPSLPFLSTRTPTPTITATPAPPTATPTITPTLPPSETPTPSGPTTYTVEVGDSLWSIAEEFEVDVLVLMDANGLTDPDAIFVGQELIIPPPGTELPTPTALPETLVAGTRIEYVVQPGDTLESIASRFNSTAEAIAEASDIEVTDMIGVGQRLLVPVGIATPTPTRIPGTPTRTPIP
jgi:LysM repeat protein